MRKIQIAWAGYVHSGFEETWNYQFEPTLNALLGYFLKSVNTGRSDYTT